MELPHEILIEILVRLPVKSLLRFKSVSKRFFSLISDPWFAAFHHKHSKRIRSHKALLPISTRLLSLDLSNATSFTDQAAFVNFIDLSFKAPDSTGLVRIVGSCNGLVCLCFDRHRNFFIWNPCTGAYTKLPDPYIPYANNFANTYLYGFGYDASTNDYKVFFAVGCEFLSFIYTHVFIYTTKTGSWRKIEHNFDFQCCESGYWQPAEQGFLLNGALHWLMAWICLDPIHVGYSDSKGDIIAFDIAEEKFRGVPMPMPNVDQGFFPCFLGILDGCLCLIRWARRIDDTVDLWMMRDYGVQSSWEKLFSCVEDFLLLPCGLVPLSFTGCGELILISTSGKELIRFNPDLQRIQERWVIDNNMRFPPEPGEATLYIETLISPNFLV